MVVLADRTQAPSGAGYALENRRVISKVLPSLYRDSQVHRLAPFFRSLRAAPVRGRTGPGRGPAHRGADARSPERNRL